MARAANSSAATSPASAGKIVDIDVSEEMQGSFLEYAYSVIHARALPDARDGLKPVQRRILFQMAEMGLRPERPYVKSARVVGEVMGKLHPHGDSAIYDALVRMAQDFSLRLPLVDGHGNFGSLDDGPAASRYTEARLAAAAIAMTADLDEDVVDFQPNYDNKLLQPEVLPAAFPNLLVNGTSGIAVGMATNMAPHNLIEVVAAARHLIDNPDASLEDLMRFVPGPDLPTGGRIVGLDGVRDAYASGRGSFRTQAACAIEKISPRRQGIVVTELPYLVGPEKVIEKIKDGVQAKKLVGISAVSDLTDRKHGLRLVIEIKNGFNPEAVLAQLYRYTPMEESFGINNVALIDGQPQTLGLKELLQVWVDHRISVVRRRCEYRLARRQERLHLVDGLLIAILDIDEVIQVIRSSDDADAARGRLQTVFELSQLQADYILELRLRRLTKFSRIELEQEQAKLRAEIAELTEILSKPELLKQLVSSQMAEVAAVHGTPRRTVLLESAGQQTPAQAAKATPLEVADGPCHVLLSATGIIARTVDGEPISRTGGRSAHDAITSCVAATIRGEVGLVTSLGRLIKFPVLDLAALTTTVDAPGLAGGAPVSALVPLGTGECVVGLASLLPDAAPLAIGTLNGTVKRVLTSDAPSSKDEWEVISLKDQDAVVGVGHAADDAELVFVSSDASLLRYSAAAVRPQGRSASGMAGIKLGAGENVVFFGAVTAAQLAAEGEEAAVVVTVSGARDALAGTAAGSAKVSEFNLFPAKGRATRGVRSQRFLRGEDSLIHAWVGGGPPRAVGSGGQPVQLPDLDPRRDGSGVQLPTVLGGIG